MTHSIRIFAVPIIFLLLSICKMLTTPAYTTPPPPICPVITATATPKLQVMGITQPPEQMALQGKPFPPLDIGNYLYSNEYPAGELTWKAFGGGKTTAEIAQGILEVEIADPDWRGSETVDVEACDPAGKCATQSVVYTVMENDALKVTYVCNEGFILETSEKKVMIDAVLWGPPPTCTDLYQNLRKSLMGKALPPFDHADLLLASHVHSDHYFLHSVGDYLQNSPSSAFLTDSGSASLFMTNYKDADLVKDRVQGVRIPSGQSKRVTTQGIDLEIIQSAPGDEYSLAFIINLDGFTIFHAGDSGSDSDMVDFYQSYNLAGKNLDVAFIPWWNMMGSNRQSIVDEGIHARYYVPMHIAPADACLYQKIQGYYPEAVPFTQEMQSWWVLRE